MWDVRGCEAKRVAIVPDVALFPLHRSRIVQPPLPVSFPALYAYTHAFSLCTKTSIGSWYCMRV